MVTDDAGIWPQAGIDNGATCSVFGPEFAGVSATEVWLPFHKELVPSVARRVDFPMLYGPTTRVEAPHSHPRELKNAPVSFGSEGAPNDSVVVVGEDLVDGYGAKRSLCPCFKPDVGLQGLKLHSFSGNTHWSPSRGDGRRVIQRHAI